MVWKTLCLKKIRLKGDIPLKGQILLLPHAGGQRKTAVSAGGNAKGIP